MNADQIANVRTFMLGITGLCCLTYAVLAVILGRPDPMPWWIPLACGLGAGGIITISFFSAGHRSAKMANDEGYHADNQRAQRHAYWIAVFLYPVFAVPILQSWVTASVAFAAMGTLTGAAYLLLFVWYDLRGRG